MKKTRHASPIILAALCAVGVHTLLFTDAGHRMQGAITEAGTEISDSRLILDGDAVSLVVQRDISNATHIDASLMYDNASLTLSRPVSNLGTIKTQSEEYNDDISIVLDTPQDIKKGTTLATWEIIQSLPEIHTINLSEVTIESSEGTITLSTQGTGAF